MILAAYLVFVTWASLAPAETFKNFSPLFPHADKALHFLLYGFMVALSRWALAAHWALRATLPWEVVAAIMYGSLMEILQGVLLQFHRSFELADIVANSLGALCFWWLSRWLLHPSSAGGIDPVERVASATVRER